MEACRGFRRAPRTALKAPIPALPAVPAASTATRSPEWSTWRKRGGGSPIDCSLLARRARLVPRRLRADRLVTNGAVCPPGRPRPLRLAGPSAGSGRACAPRSAACAAWRLGVDSAARLGSPQGRGCSTVSSPRPQQVDVLREAPPVYIVHDFLTEQDTAAAWKRPSTLAEGRAPSAPPDASGCLQRLRPPRRAPEHGVRRVCRGLGSPPPRAPTPSSPRLASVVAGVLLHDEQDAAAHGPVGRGRRRHVAWVEAGPPTLCEGGAAPAPAGGPKGSRPRHDGPLPPAGTKGQ